MSYRPGFAVVFAVFAALVNAPIEASAQAVTSLGAASEWQFEAQSDDPDDPVEGYTLYERESDGYRALKIRAVFDAPPSEVIRAVVFRLRSSEYLAAGETRRKLHESETEVVNYSILDLPMISDRDMAIRATHSREGDGGPYLVQWSSADDLAPPVSEDLVRMKSEGFWKLSELPDGRTLGLGESHIQLGGSIPGWIAGGLMQDNMLENLAVLRGIVRDRKAELPVLVFVDHVTPAVSAGTDD